MGKKKKSKTKSPLKDKPLRNPGQSGDANLYEFLMDNVVMYFFASVAFIYLAIMEWIRYYNPAKPNPVIYTVLALIVVLYSVYKIRKALPAFEKMKQGRDGERAVGQHLERLREKGAKVFHDIQCDGFNIDHVVIHKSGIYVIETKTYSKPEKGRAIITFDGEKVHLNGKESYGDSITQVISASKWLQRQIKESTGKQFKLKEVVLFPGWFVQPTAEAKKSNVWVLEPKAIEAFIENSKEQFSDEDVSLVAYHLSRYVRSKENERTK